VEVWVHADQVAALIQLKPQLFPAPSGPAQVLPSLHRKCLGLPGDLLGQVDQVLLALERKPDGRKVAGDESGSSAWLIILLRSLDIRDRRDQCSASPCSIFLTTIAMVAGSTLA